VVDGETDILRYGYDVANGVSVLTYPDGKVVRRKLDLRERLDSVVVDGKLAADYDYSAISLSSRKLGNGIVARYSYDKAGRVGRLAYTGGVSGLPDFSYGYDMAGNMRYAQKNNRLDKSETYEYDAAYQLIRWKNGTLTVADTTIPAPDYYQAWALDKRGNWSRFDDNSRVETSTYDSQNQLIKRGSLPFSYDKSGNLSNAGSDAFRWDAKNALSAVNQNEYHYDAIGRRIRKRAGNGADVRFVFDGWQEIKETSSEGRIVIAINGGSFDEIACQFIDGHVYYGIINHQLSTIANTDSSGDIAELYAYSPYGNLTVTDKNGTPKGGALSNIGLYTGRYWEGEYHGWNFRRRNYGGSLGRFLSRDPLGHLGSANEYAFVSNDPINRVDPLGLKDYRLGSNDPQMKSDPGAGVWASESPSIAMILMKNFVQNNAWKIWIAMPDAVRNLNHYLGNSGSDLNLRLQGMINEVPSAEMLFNSELALAMSFVETLPNGNHQITSGTKSGGYNLKSESWNWFYAVGGYSAWGKGNAKVCDKDFTLEYEYKVFDRYNWDKGKSVTILGVRVTDEFMGAFHRMGIAREFDMRGSVKKTVKWTKGSPPTISN
jgi:RHS repeat-associated protein